MKDKSTPDIPSQNVTHFSDGDSYVTMWDAAGIQYGENTWGTAPTPNYVYLGANFSTALTPRVYKTSKLTIELFYE